MKRKKNSNKRTKRNTKKLNKNLGKFAPVILLSVVIFLLIFPLIAGLNRWIDSELTLVENNYSDEAFANELLVIVKDINPNTGIGTFDIRLQTPVEDEQIEMIIHSGNVLRTSESQTLEYQSVLHRVQTMLDTPETFDRTNLEQTIYSKEDLKIRLGVERSGYLFPFDKYFLQFNFLFLNPEKEQIQTLINFELDDSRFVHSRPVANLTYGREITPVPNSFVIFVERPVHQKIFVCIVIILTAIIILWSFYRVVHANIELTESLEIIGLNLGILLAVPDIRGLLVPDNLEFALFFDYSVVTLWIMSLFTLGVFIFKAGRKRLQNEDDD